MVPGASASGHPPDIGRFGLKGSRTPLLQLLSEPLDFTLCRLPAPHLVRDGVALCLAVADPALGDFGSVHKAGRMEGKEREEAGVGRQNTGSVETVSAEDGPTW